MAAACLPRCLRASARSQRAGLPNKGKVVRKGSGKRTSYAREIQAAVVRVLMSNTRHLGSVWLRRGNTGWSHSALCLVRQHENGAVPGSKYSP